jgi:salicylate 5-hydroxylase small subunit
VIAAASISPDERLAIEDLYAEYAAVLDDQRFEEWPDLFTDDCTYKIVPRETLAFESKGMLRDRVYGVTQTLFHEPYYQRHLVSGFQLRRLTADAYAVRANYLVVRTKAGALSELYSAGRYADVVVRDAGRLLFKEKLCIFDSELIPNSMIYPL